MSSRASVIALTPVFAAVAPPATACPDQGASGETFRSTGPDLYTPKRFRVTAGGDFDVQRCPHIRSGTDRGRGFFAAPPDVTFFIEAMSRFQVVLSVVSECDSTRLINTATNSWFYDDDDNGNFDAKIILTRPADGWLDVWIGPHDGRSCDAVLSLETVLR